MAEDVLSKIWPEWRVIRVLGKGSYGTVYEVERTDASLTIRSAVKVITIPQNETEVDSLMAEGMTVEDTRHYYRRVVQGFTDEISIMESLKGVPNIVSVEDYKVIERTDRFGWNIYIRMELLTSFNDYLGSHHLDENGIIDLGIDMCSALERCARLNIIHRDIKPENIFVNSFGDYKLGDFGIARRFENLSSGMSIKGTFNYMAPEVEKGYDYDATVDTYSLGLVLYRLANDNLPPFLSAKEQMNPNARVMAVRRRLNGEALPDPCDASPGLAQIIRIACDPIPGNRFRTATAMKMALKSLKDTEDSHVVGQQPLPVYQAPAPSPSIQTRQNKKSPARIVVPVVIAVALAAILVAAGILFLPDLIAKFREREASVKIETQTEAVIQSDESLVETEAASVETTVPESTVPETTVPETTKPAGSNYGNQVETTTAPAKSYSVGDVIGFGHYEQNSDQTDGFEEIKWIVLAVEEDRILVISQLGLDGKQYDSTGKKNVPWDQCTLRQWLNSVFLNTAFSADEQSRIQETYVTAEKNSKYPDRNPGNDTIDRVFLLSISEAEYYFSSNAQRSVTPTSYAISQGVKYCNNKDNQGYGYWWWLRNPGREEDYAALVFPEGSVDYVGYHYNDTENAVRPAMWITP